jgi:hypothetical protein
MSEDDWVLATAILLLFFAVGEAVYAILAH